MGLGRTGHTGSQRLIYLQETAVDESQRVAAIVGIHSAIFALDGAMCNIGAVVNIVPIDLFDQFVG